MIAPRFPRFGNGRKTAEFRDHESHSRLVNAPVFCRNPYHAWEKGTVENTTGLCREFFRKGARIPEAPDLFSNAIATK